MSDMLEPAIVPDIFVQGVGRVEEASANLFRVSYDASQRAFDGSQERICAEVHRHGRNDEAHGEHPAGKRRAG